jgi:hypothetical protein
MNEITKKLVIIMDYPSFKDKQLISKKSFVTIFANENDAMN